MEILVIRSHLLEIVVILTLINRLIINMKIPPILRFTVRMVTLVLTTNLTEGSIVCWVTLIQLKSIIYLRVVGIKVMIKALIILITIKHIIMLKVTDFIIWRIILTKFDILHFINMSLNKIFIKIWLLLFHFIIHLVHMIILLMNLIKMYIIEFLTLALRSIYGCSICCWKAV